MVTWDSQTQRLKHSVTLYAGEHDNWNKEKKKEENMIIITDYIIWRYRFIKAPCMEKGISPGQWATHTPSMHR